MLILIYQIYQTELIITTLVLHMYNLHDIQKPSLPCRVLAPISKKRENQNVFSIAMNTSPFVSSN